MPLRDDFRLYLNGARVIPSKVDLPMDEKLVIGKDFEEKTLGPPSPKDIELSKDESVPKKSVHYFGLTHPELGRMTGYAELYKDDITQGKSENIERSNGFFVYVRERLINADDPGFGIPRNLLRHGTFSRMRLVVHIDSLNEVLRSSRESVRHGELNNLARNFLHSIFNLN